MRRMRYGSSSAWKEPCKSPAGYLVVHSLYLADHLKTELSNTENEELAGIRFASLRDQRSLSQCDHETLEISGHTTSHKFPALVPKTGSAR